MPAPTAAQVWRDYVTDGIPSSGNHRPAKAAIRAWGAWLESFITASGSNAGSVFATKADLTANLARVADSMAWVVNDPTTANNGIYRKNGASGSGSWTRIADLPYSFVKLTDTGAGTANAIQLTSTIPTSPAALRVANAFEVNTGNVTISENGDTAKPLLTSSGNQIAAGGLVANIMIVYVDDGTAFRLLSDQASAAIVAAAEAAQVAAEAARDAALAAVPNVFPLTRTALKAFATTITSAYLKEAGREGQFTLRSGSIPLSDPNEGVYVASNTAGYYWERLAHGMKFDVRWFGAKLDNSTDDTAAFQAAIDFASLWANTPYSPRSEVYCPPGFIFKTTTALICNTPIRLDIRSLQFHYGTSGFAWDFHTVAPAIYSSRWHVWMEGVYAQPGTGGVPASQNGTGPSAFRIRSMIYSDFYVGQINGFSNIAIYFDGTGTTYSNQVIQHNRFTVGLIVYNGVGIYARSLNSTGSQFQGNEVHVQQINGNFLNISDGDASYFASSSNSWYLNAMDNEGSVGIDTYCAYNKWYIGFTGQPGTSLRLNGANCDYNRFEFSNNVSTDIVINHNSPGDHNTIICQPPSNLPQTGVTVTNGVDYHNDFGCPISVFVPVSGGGTYALYLTGPSGTATISSAMAANGPITIPVKPGWKWKLFTTGGTVTYGTASIFAA